MKLSNDNLYLSYAILTYRNELKLDNSSSDSNQLKFYHQSLALLKSNKNKQLKVDELVEILKYQGHSIELINSMKDYKLPHFPLTKTEEILLKLPVDNSMKTFKFLSIVFLKLRNIWIESYFKKTRDDLLNYFNDKAFMDECIVEYENLNVKKKNTKVKKK